mmetsp:Transcript_15698/g.34001  ORF Transcript_15698/g.34001 Transcript_15698/m.34001 type:complete len:154 (-) Transcript_15698:2473-2934(-)
MIDISFLHKMTSSPRGPARKRLRKSIGGYRNTQHNNKTLDQIAAEHRSEFLSDQILHQTWESYDQGVSFLNLEKYDDATECFEAALAARLVLYGPDNECVLRVHQKLYRIAHIQGDAKKATHHRLKILRLQSILPLNEEHKFHDTVDWSVLCE